MTLLLGVPARLLCAQQSPAPPPQQPDAGTGAQAPANAPATAIPATGGAEPTKSATGKDRRHAAKLYLDGTKLFEKEQFDEALRDYQQAAELDPGNTTYSMAAEVARSHAVTALVQAAAKARMKSDAMAEQAALQRAAELDPKNPQVAQHLNEMADDAAAERAKPMYEEEASSLGPAPELLPVPGKHSFHLRADRRQMIQTVFRSYGIEAAVDQSVSGAPVKLELDDATFAQAVHAASVVTQSFSVPLDAHRVLVAKDTLENRRQYLRQELETVYLGGMDTKEMTDIGNMAKNIFQAQQVVVDPSAGRLTIRAPSSTLKAFNSTVRELLDGRSQVMLEVRLIQLARNHVLNTGVTPPQQITVFNVYSEEQAILNANQALVQQIISSGLAAPGDTLAILGILLASGQVSNSIFQNGIALFGGGLTLTGISPAPATLSLSLNSSESRELDQLQLRLSDGEEGTLKAGMRYPIMTSSFSNLGVAGANIPGLTTAGSSSSLSSLLSALNAPAPNIPQVEYQDLGLTLKATPRVIRSGEIALNLDMKITALGAASLNGVPVLNNRSYSGVFTVKEGTAAVLVSEVDQEESRALSGWPGLSEIPGLNNITNKDTDKSYASLLIIITPRVVRGTQAAGHSPMMRVERGITP
jgi:type II secretory pathway component GspD/PulD (secretin)